MTCDVCAETPRWALRGGRASRPLNYGEHRQRHGDADPVQLGSTVPNWGPPVRCGSDLDAKRRTKGFFRRADDGVLRDGRVSVHRGSNGHDLPDLRRADRRSPQRAHTDFPSTISPLAARRDEAVCAVAGLLVDLAAGALRAVPWDGRASRVGTSRSHEPSSSASRARSRAAIARMEDRSAIASPTSPGCCGDRASGLDWSSK